MYFHGAVGSSTEESLLLLGDQYIRKRVQPQKEASGDAHFGNCECRTMNPSTEGECSLGSFLFDGFHQRGYLSASWLVLGPSCSLTVLRAVSDLKAGRTMPEFWRAMPNGIMSAVATYGNRTSCGCCYERCGLPERHYTGLGRGFRFFFA